MSVLILYFRIGIFDDWRNLGEHVVNILKHGALGSTKTARAADVFDDLLVLMFYFIEKLAERLELVLGGADHG